jgi:hypothetical protein
MMYYETLKIAQLKQAEFERDLERKRYRAEVAGLLDGRQREPLRTNALSAALRRLLARRANACDPAAPKRGSGRWAPTHL